MSQIKSKKNNEEDEDIPRKKIALTDGKTEAKFVGLGSTVAEHYNKIEEKGLLERNKSRIVYLRNFNNWIKSVLIGEWVRKCKLSNKYLNVMDMCCGKGGDLMKWNKGGINRLICADIADVSIEQCKSRYLSRRYRFHSEFIVADCTKERLKPRFQNNDILLDIVSCQFSFHYCFESLPQAECMLRNASECLKPGGYFIGTLPDANEIVARLKKSNSNAIGNDVYRIEFQCNTKNIPLFGAKYDFFLEGVVNCPEFLVHFPTLIRLAKKYNLELVRRERFPDFYEKRKNNDLDLIYVINALETYPPDDNVSLQGKPEEYKHAQDYLNRCNDKSKQIGTISSNEWETICLYTTFVFQKFDARTA